MPASKKTTDTDRKIGALIRKHRLAIAPEWQLLPPSWRGLTARTQNRGGNGEQCRLVARSGSHIASTTHLKAATLGAFS